MSKFRIVRLIHDVNMDDRYNEWVIEQKKFWRWKEIVRWEGPKSKLISHKSYEDAENYMFKKYMGHGICEQNGNVYKFTNYTYHGM